MMKCAQCQRRGIASGVNDDDVVILYQRASLVRLSTIGEAFCETLL
jgi:hypothetical protein